MTYSSKDFHYYFAISSGDLDRYGPLRDQDVLISLAFIPTKPAAREAAVKKLKAHKGRVMIDSGGFSNFNKPGLVSYESWAEFMGEHKSWVTEYVQFDDLRSRAKTLAYYEKAKKAGLDPLLVDHLHFRQRPATLEKLWKALDKLCVAGFGKFLPGQQQIAGDDAGRSQFAMKNARGFKTMTHLLAVGSLKKFLPHVDLIHSVDSAVWKKLGGYGRFLHFRYDKIEDMTVPVLVQYFAPGSSNAQEQPAPPEVVSKGWHAVIKANNWGKEPHAVQAHLVSLYHSKRYIAAMRKFDCQELRERIESKNGERIQKMLAEPSENFEIPDDDPRDPTTSDSGWTVAKAVSGTVQREAERAKKNDKLTLDEFFYQSKPTRPAFPQQPQTVESLIALYKQYPEWLPAFIQKKYDGARHQIHKDGDKVVILSEEGDDNTDRMPGVVAEVKALKEKKLVLDAELERWDGPHHLPREAAVGYINSKSEPDDSDLVANVFDSLLTATDGDIHKWPTHRRLRKLAGLGIKQSTMKAPSLKDRLNEAPSIKVNDLEELEKVVRMVRELPGSEGVVIKQADSTYPLEKEAVDIWVKYHNASLVRGIVQSRTKVKDGGWVYQWAVLPGKDDPVETATVDGTKVVPVGDTFTTKLDFDEGDLILVEVEQLNFTRTPKGVEITGWVPRVIGDYTGKADTVDKAVSRAKKDLVLREKKVDEEGEVTYVPVARVLKQADPYMEVPPEEGTYRYSAQHHWRGKGFHADVRLGFRPGKLLVGWTMNTQIAGVVKKPVVTLAQAKQWARHMDEVSKINWNTGEWAERAKRGAEKPVRVQILCERKSSEPWAWIDVEGKTKDPVPGEAPPVGGTRHFPGVFHMVDQGTVEFLAQKSWFHEYAFHGDGLNYRMFYRQLRLGALQKARHSYSRCMECVKSPEVDVLWADGRGRAWFCKTCYPAWLKKMGGRAKAEVVGEKKIIGGNAPAEFSDVHKRVEVAKAADPHPYDAEVRKQRKILPPSEAQGERAVDEPSWLAIYPDDQEPYVLDKDAVEKRWMPPLGLSALPRAIRSQVPAKFHYWKRRTIGDARKTRDELHAAVKAKELELDYSAPYKEGVRKASLLDADFVLQEQTWRGPVQIRTGPSRTLWWLRLDVGRRALIALRMMLNPLDNKRLNLFVEEDAHKGSMKVDGPIKPGHYLNPTKETPSNISILDKGKAEVLSLSKDFVKVRLAGKKLKGLIGIKRNNEEWLWSPAEAGSKTETQRDVGKRAEDIVSGTWFVPILKVSKEKRLVTGVVLEPGTIDAQGDIISEEVIERAEGKFLSLYNDKTRLGVMHKSFGDVGLELHACWVALQSLKVQDKKVKKGSWLMTMKVTSDERWAKVKKGEYAGFSIGGVATVA